jgi:hypothetical protein
MSAIPCLLCGKRLNKRVDKNGKPYFVCDPCGIQLFIRRPQGIENLGELIQTLGKKDLPFRDHALVLYEIQAILGEIRGLRKELDALDSIFDLFSNNKEKKRTRRLLERRIDGLFSRLERIAES